MLDCLQYMSDMSNLLVIFNSSANFWVYLIFGKDYRRVFVYRFCCWKPSLQTNTGFSTGAHLETPSVSETGFPSYFTNGQAVACNGDTNKLEQEVDAYGNHRKFGDGFPSGYLALHSVHPTYV